MNNKNMRYDAKYFVKLFRECPQQELCALIDANSTYVEFVGALVHYLSTHDVSEFNKFIKPSNPVVSGIDPFIFSMYWFYHCKFEFLNQVVVSEVVSTNISLTSLLSSQRLRMTVSHLDVIPQGVKYQSYSENEWGYSADFDMDLLHLERALVKVQLVTNLTL